MGFLYSIGKTFAIIVTLLIVLAYIPGIPPHVNFSSVKLEPALILEENDILDHAEKLYDGHIISPESIASQSDDEIFTSTKDGSIVRIWGNNWENSEIVTRIGPSCDVYWEEHICGRALGIRFDKSGRLLVADSYLGIFAVDVKTGKQQRLFDPNVPIDGFKPLIFDDLDIDSAGNIYWSDASHLANLADGVLAIFADPSGRLIKYDPKTKKNTVLVQDLAFANGVQLSPDESFVLVSETPLFRIQRHWLKGPKKGKTEVFVSGLPGCPDNIRPRKNGGYYISLVAMRLSDKYINIMDFIAQNPAARRLIVRIQWNVKALADIVNNLYPNTFCAQLSHNMLNLEILSHYAPLEKAIVVEIDENGTVVGSLQGSGISHVSQTNQVGDNIFFGSPYNKYLGRLKLSNIEGSRPPMKRVTPKSKDEL